jgi:hypothetical protein
MPGEVTVIIVGSFADAGGAEAALKQIQSTGSAGRSRCCACGQERRRAAAHLIIERTMLDEAKFR